MDPLITMLKAHEGVRLKPYVDTVGKTTIGVGRNLTDNGITAAEADAMLAYDISVARTALASGFRAFQALDDVRQAVLTDMCFNMGWPRLSAFKNTLSLIEHARYNDAAAAMLDSLWAKQVGNRAVQLAQMMRTGKWA